MKVLDYIKKECIDETTYFVKCYNTNNKCVMIYHIVNNSVTHLLSKTLVECTRDEEDNLFLIEMYDSSYVDKATIQTDNTFYIEIRLDINVC